MAQRHSSKSYDNCNRQYVLSYADLKFSVGDHSSSIQKLCRALLTSETSSSNPNTQNKNGKEKIIINGISGSARSGQMISVMGPSGAGKTTLLNILSLRATYGKKNEGDLLLDGKRLDNKVFKEKCFLVGQYDKNWPHLTVCETCTFAARLFGSTAGDISTIVSEVIDEVGLTSVSNSRNSSLSGGQQRRLSLAIALLKQPEVLFLDEVTSGLDSASSDKVCNALRQIVDEKNIMVICTIHQPSTRIFLECFDELILLSKGRIAYSGGTRNAKDYFAKLGHSIPAMTNPAEYYMELVNSDFGGDEAVNEILDAWTKGDDGFEDEEGQDHSLHRHGDTGLPHSELFSKPSLMKETQIILQRQFKMACRDPVLYIGRCIVSLIMNCCFAMVYWNARNYTQDQAMAMGWLVVWFSAVPMMLGAVAVYVLNDELKAIQSEQKNGMLRPISYIMAKTILSLPFSVLFALFSLGIPGFVLMSYLAEPFFQTIALWCVFQLLHESLAESLAVWIKDKVLGMMVYLAYWIASFLFSGLFLPFDDIPDPLKVFYYVTPFSYYIRSGFYLLYKDATFEPCDSASNPFEPICVESSLGKDVIESLHNVLPLFENKDTFAEDIGVLLLMAFVFKTLYILGAIVRGREVSIPRPASKEEENNENRSNSHSSFPIKIDNTDQSSNVTMH